MKRSNPYLYFVFVLLFIFGMKIWSERIKPSGETFSLKTSPKLEKQDPQRKSESKEGSARRTLPFEQVIDLDSVSGGEAYSSLGQRESDQTDQGLESEPNLGKSAGSLRQLSDILGVSFQTRAREPAQSVAVPRGGSDRPVTEGESQDLEIEPVFEVRPRKK